MYQSASKKIMIKPHKAIITTQTNRLIKTKLNLLKIFPPFQTEETPQKIDVIKIAISLKIPFFNKKSLKKISSVNLIEQINVQFKLNKSDLILPLPPHRLDLRFGKPTYYLYYKGYSEKF